VSRPATSATIDGIAARQACSKRHVSILVPSLVKAAVDGRLPRGIGVARLFDAPVAWPRQQQMLGFAHWSASEKQLIRYPHNRLLGGSSPAIG
jgi:hypothetical protein